MASENRKFNRSKKLPKGWSTKEKRTFYIVGFIVIIFGGIFSRFVFQSFDGGEKPNQQYITGILPDSMVCMAANRINSKTTDSIFVDGMTYWGCCSNCRSKLLNNENNIQFAIDPQSGNQVRKSETIIYADPVNLGKILYFESEDNYRTYMNFGE